MRRSARAAVLVALAPAIVVLPAGARGISERPLARLEALPGAFTSPPPRDVVEPGGRPSESDLEDELPGHQTHVIYFVPANREDENLDQTKLPVSIDAIRSWFARETGASGPAIQPRFDRDTTGAWDISFVRGAKNAGEYTDMNDIVDELVAKGFDQAMKRYLIFSATSRDGVGNPGGICGEGDYPWPGFPVRNYAVVHLDSGGCNARVFAVGPGPNGGKRAEAIAVHEWLHNEGMTPFGAPKQCASSITHVCTGPLWALPRVDGVGYLDPEHPDVMYPLITVGLGEKSLDRDHDDYLDHPGVWTDLRDSPWFESA